MPARLYVVDGSHPCAAVARAMDMNAVAYEVVEIVPPLHAPLQQLRFGARTVPGLVLESGEKISGSRAIMRRVEELAPNPPLFPDDAAARARVEEAEAWGDEVWQQVARSSAGSAPPRPPAARPHARSRG
jgi:glutathione S-transferase